MTGQPRPVMQAPANLDAERRVLGAVLQYGLTAYVQVELEPDDFFLEPHRHIWRAVQEVGEAGVAIDVITVGEALSRAKVMESVGGPMFLGDLMGEVGSQVGITHHADTVAEYARKRRYIETGTQIANMGYSPDATAEEIREFAESKVMGVSETFASRRSSVTRVGPVVQSFLEGLDERMRTGVTPGMPTGFHQLDQITLGLHKTDLVILAGRPGMGKTSLTLAMMLNMCATNWAAMFSLEMPNEQLVMRMAAARAGVDLKELRGGKVTPDMIRRVAAVSDELASLKLHTDDTSAVGMGHIRTVCRKLKLMGQLDLVFIDYLTLMKPGNGETKTAQVGDNTTALKALAKDLNVTVVVLAQLNRGLESRQDKRPILSDLRDSGEIEQAADVILFVYRDEYYHPESEDKGIGEVIVAKQRNGPTDTARLAWIEQRAAFSNLYPGDGFNP